MPDLAPQEFQETVERAAQSRDTVKLTLLGMEAAGFPWELDGMRRAGRALMGLKEFGGAKTVWESLLLRHGGDTEAIYALDNVRSWEGTASSDNAVERMIVFAGHRIDDPSRKASRFPAAAEPKARAAIRDALFQEKGMAQGIILGLAGGANGGDILFHEVCRELGIPTRLLLAIPEGAYITASVATEGNGWVRRFQAIRDAQEKVPVLAPSAELPAWLKAKEGYSIWNRNNLWLIATALCAAPKHLTILVLWDGKGGDGPGGTEDMVRVGKQRGARVVHLNTREIFEIPGG